MRIGIKEKLLGSYILILLIIIIASIIILSRVFLLQNFVTETLNHPLTVTRAAIKTEVLVVEMHRTMKDITLINDTDLEKQFLSIINQKETEILSEFNIIDKQILGEEGKKLSAKARQYFLEWKPVRNMVITLMHSGDKHAARAITMNEGAAHVNRVLNALTNIEEYASYKAMAFARDSRDIATNTQILIISFLVFICLLGVWIIWYLSVSITNRISLISQAAKKMASGDMNQRIKVSGKDELSLMADTFNTMITQIKFFYNSMEAKVVERTIELEKANADLQELKAKLEENVSAKTLDLAEKVEELDKSQKAMLFMVEDLNDTSRELRDKQEKLASANKELEAFAYSVSHDLRAPLRAINGFTNVLLEEYVNNLDDEGKRIGNIIRQNAIKMGQLIDDLLSFSRIGRKEMHFSDIDMEELASSVYQEIISTEQTGDVEFSIADLPRISGDLSMIRQVWVNLLSNAVKFSSRKKKIEIHVGFTENEDSVVFFVKDNGAGFDMQFKDKLFGVFQRLHHQKEFDGTGVGLALVQRIIQRHKGDVWAEGKTEKGATFYFSIPKNKLEI